MRQAGTLSNRDDAQRLVDYLLTLGIAAKVEPDGDRWALWIREEDQVPQAVQELQNFQADPQGARYRQAADAAVALRKQQSREDDKRRKNLIEMRNRWDMRPSGRQPITLLLIAISVLVAILTQAGENLDSPVLKFLWFAPPQQTLGFFEQLSWTPTKYIDAGQVWRLVTPIFIHYGPMHLVFNMYMLYLFGSIIEMRRGSLRFGLLVLATAIAANYAQYFFPYRLHWGSLATTGFGGMSGVVYGLLGYMWMKSRFEPLLQIFISPGTVLFLIAWLVLGWSGALDEVAGGAIANWEHTAGLVAGMIIGYAPVAWRKIVRN